MRVRSRRARRPSHAASEVVKAAVAEAKSRAVGVDRADCGNVRFIVLPEVTTDDDSVVVDDGHRGWSVVVDSDDGGDAEPQVMAPATTRGARKVGAGVVAAEQVDATVGTEAADVVAEMAAASRWQITRDNAQFHPPPSLYDFMSPASRVGTAPAVWYERLTGKAWDMTGRSYHIATNKWRLLLPGKRERARECDRRRDRTSRVRKSNEVETE